MDLHTSGAEVTVCRGFEVAAVPVSECDFDPSDPPADPPRGADDLLWRLGYALLQAHEVRADGFCSCREFVPCDGILLAVRGLREACRPGRRLGGLADPRWSANASARWDAGAGRRRKGS